MSDALDLQSRPEIPSKSGHETILAQSVGELKRFFTVNQSGRVEVAEGREDHRAQAVAPQVQSQLLALLKGARHSVVAEGAGASSVWSSPAPAPAAAGITLDRRQFPSLSWD